VAFQAHRRAALNIEDNAIALILGCHDWLRACIPGHGGELCTIGPVEPGQTFPYLIGVDTATGNALDLGPFPRQDRGARKVMEIGLGSHRADVVLPARGKTLVHIERDPVESGAHASNYQSRADYLGNGALAIPLSASTSVGA
jgi:hypothetical protein